MKISKTVFRAAGQLCDPALTGTRLREEIDEHIALQTAENLRAGLSPVEARRQAMVKFGGVEAMKQEYRSVRGLLLIENLLQDVRYAIRSLRRTPGLTAFVVITLALGIGMTAATFSMVDGLIFRPYPVPHPGSVVTLVSTTHDSNFDDFSYREYLDIRDKTKSYDGVIANADMQAVGFSAEPGATPRIKGGMMVSGNYFHVLGVEPRLGRGFREDEDQVPGPRCRGGARAGFLETRIRERPIRPRAHHSPERRAVHRHWRGSGDFPRDAYVRASRLLRAAGDGRSIFDQLAEKFLRGSRRSRIKLKSAPETGRDAAASPQ